MLKCLVDHTRWYICEETALSIWTGILYIQYLKSSISKAWYVSSTPSCNFILIFFCAFLVFFVLFGGMRSGEAENSMFGLVI